MSSTVAAASSVPPPLPDAALLLAQATSLTTPCGTGHMVWRRWGPADGRPLVLLHGGSGSWTHWIRSIEPLTADGCTLWVPDLPGFGDSDVPPDGGDADAVAPVLLDGLRALFGSTPVDVAGFSFGSFVATLAAAQDPAPFARLVLVGSPALALAGSLRLRIWQHLRDENARRAVHRHNLGVLMLHDPATISDAVVDLHAANMARDRLRERRLVRTDTMARALATLQLPLHAIYGRHDALYADRWAQVEALLHSLPALRSLRYVEDAGHWVQFEAPEAFHALLRQALSP